MRIAYLDCFAGISGDMFLGALIDAGAPLQAIRDAVSALNLDATLRVDKVDRSGITCTRVIVMEGDKVAEDQPHTHQEKQGALEQSPRAEAGYTQQPKTQHLHKTGVPHEHPHTHPEAPAHHHHGRSLSVIRELIQSASLEDRVKKTALRAFELLGYSEAKIHNVPVEQIHFHEVGAVDAIVDIVAVSAGIHALNVDAWHCSPLNVGGGSVECAHGTFPVPAPAVSDLLRGVPTYSAHVQDELVTPTGAALIRAIDPIFGQQPSMRVEQIGYGAGSRNPAGFPNAVRIQIGTASLAVSEDHQGEMVTVLETALDDLSPQVTAYVTERALAEGALDVMLTPVIMKKGRPGTLLTVLCDSARRPALEGLLLRETSTLGLRIREERRVCLERSHIAVATPYGEIKVKVGSWNGEEFNAAPEFEDCRSAALRCDVSVKQVQQAAIAAYLQQKAHG